MPLDEGQQRRNEPFIDNIFIKIDEIFKSEEVLKKLPAIRKKLTSTLIENEILLSFPEADKRMIEIICGTILDDTSEKFESELSAWIKYYKELEANATLLLNEKGADQVIGISVVTKDKGDPSKVWGTDKDLLSVLRGVIKTPQDANNAIEILTPVNLQPGPNVSPGSGEKEEPWEAMRFHIKTVIDKNPNKKMLLLIPAMCSESHWRLAIVKIKHNKVDRAKLWDSNGSVNDFVSGSRAGRNLQRAITLVNKNEKVKVKGRAKDIQYNGHSCMDYVIQQALKLKYHDAKSQEGLSPELKAIIAAKNHYDLRVAIINAIIKNTPELTNDAALLASVGLFAKKAQEKDKNERKLERGERRPSSHISSAPIIHPGYAAYFGASFM